MNPISELTAKAREGSLELNKLTSAERSSILLAVADALDSNRDLLRKSNQCDLDNAKASNLSGQLLHRLELTSSKISTLIDGIKSLAAGEEPIARILSEKKLDDNLILVKQTASIGVLLIIFESRPDSLPQIASLALRSGNGLLLKGGKEAENTNATLHRLITDAVYLSSNGRVGRGVIGLVSTRDDIYKLLKMEGEIDLVIPRGSGAMVRSIQSSTAIPVLGHADGICHLYVHNDAVIETAIRIGIDAKLSYPAACNAAETLLLHHDLVSSGAAENIVKAMEKAGVKFFGGPLACQLGLAKQPIETFHHEYGDEHMAIEVVSNLDEACNHINKNGSHHTESIITCSEETATEFQKKVDSACVFHNASTRFADGYRFGLGAEVGISTGRIHARGPVGVEGLLTQKWLLKSLGEGGSIVEDFQNGLRHYTHESVPLGDVPRYSW